MRVLFITHPQVTVQPDVPVPAWSLSELGRKRMRSFAETLARGQFGSLWSSDERKAIEAGEILAARVGVTLQRHAALGENDRSATGYLAASAFEAAADRFFAEPECSIDGWERAVDAQARIVRALTHVIGASAPRRDIAVIAHGAVGTLLLCHLQGWAISRTRDQPGQGHWFWVECEPLRALCDWHALERHPFEL